MFELSDSDREYFTEMRALTRDTQGREVLVGLTFEETVEYVTYSKSSMSGKTTYDPEARDHYLELHDKHQRARFQVLGAEHVLRTENPVRH